MKYKLVDFKDLVTAWYNEFLPALVDESRKSGMVPGAGILYVDSIPLEPNKKESIRFMAKKLLEMKDEDTTIIVVQEPKAVNNAKLKKFLAQIESNPGIDKEHMDKLMHIANKRYIISSADILVSQDKEMDEFLDSVFSMLSILKFPNVRFYASKSLDFKDVVGQAAQIFPKSWLIVKESEPGVHIKVKSSGELMAQISLKLDRHEEEYDSSYSKFLALAEDTITSDLKSFI